MMPARQHPCRRGLLVGLAASFAAVRDVAADDLRTFIEELSKGGYVIYFRHGETGRSGADPNPVMGDCATQRNLDHVGVEQVRQLGEDFRALRIPVGKVLASEFCRCWQHAEAMFGKGGYVVTDKLSLPRSYPAVTDADRRKSNDHLRALLSAMPAAGTNTVLVSHGNNVLMLTGVHPDRQGQARIFRPGDLKPVRSVTPEQWTLARR
jgi:phosphohistidine phosphatase SixA